MLHLMYIWLYLRKCIYRTNHNWISDIFAQATSLGLAVQQVEEMIQWRLSDDSKDLSRPGESDLPDEQRSSVRCKVVIRQTFEIAIEKV